MKNRYFPLIFSNDDIGEIHEERHIKWFNDVIELLEVWNIKGTFFWIPKSDRKVNSENKIWIDAIKKAFDSGANLNVLSPSGANLEEFADGLGLSGLYRRLKEYAISRKS